MKYRAIGNWWDPKGYIDAKGNHQQCEIDIVAISADDKEAHIMEEKVAFFVQKEKRIRRYKRTVECISLKDLP